MQLSKWPRPLTIGIGVTMLVGYGTLYYPLAILGPEIAAERGWSQSFVFGIFSITLLSSAFVASLAGRMLDRFGGRAVLMAGSLCAAATLAGLSLVTTKTEFAIAMFLLQAGGCLALYEAGFAALTAIHGRDARMPITHVTLIAGFASTVFWPLIHWLLGFMDWREICLVLAAVNLVVALPIHAALPRPRRARKTSAVLDEAEAIAPVTHQIAILGQEEHRPAFVLMAVSFATSGFLMSAVHTAFFLIMKDIGRDAALAALAGAVIGPMQVGARIIEFATGGRIAASVVGVISNAALLGGILLLFVAWFVAGPAPVLAFAVAFGIGQGLAFIARAMLPARLFGTEGYGRVTGNLATIRLVFTAAGPFVAAVALDRAGIAATLGLFAVTALIGLVTAIILGVYETRADRAAVR